MRMLKSILRALTRQPERYEIHAVPSDIDLRSEEYRRFIKSVLAKKKRSLVEKLCDMSPDLGIDFPQEYRKSLAEKIVLGRLHISTRKLFSAGILAFVAGFLAGTVLYLFGLPFWVSIITGIFGLYYVWSYPSFHFSVLRTSAQDESIRIILLLSIYLRYSPNMESALAFVAANSSGPLSTDIVKAIWDVESGKYQRISDALRQYSKTWVKWDRDFVRSLNMILNSLSKLSEKEREKGIEEALENILVNSHMKMRMYTESLVPKVTILHLGGILLPVMGLLMFPMASIFLSEQINSLYIALGYTVVLPLFLGWYSWRMLSTRPGTYSVPDVSKHPDAPPRGYFFITVDRERFAIPAAPMAILIGLVVMLPGIFHFMDLGIKYYAADPAEREALMYREANIFKMDCIAEYIRAGNFDSREDCASGLENMLSTFSITAGAGIAAFLYFHLSSFQRAKLSDELRELEDDIKTGMFIVSNYLSNGAPVEIAVRKAIEQYDSLGIESSRMKDFLMRIDDMMRRQGMTFEQAISSPSVMRRYPSPLLKEILDILRESTRKSPVLAGKVISAIVKYLDNIKDVEVKIRESLEEVRNSLRMQASLITPVITGFVTSLSTFILNILKSIADQIGSIMSSLNIGKEFSAQGLMETLVGDFSKVMPFTILQVIIGIYLIEIIYVMSSLLSGIDYGFDESLKMRMAATNLMYGLITYFTVSIVSMAIFGSLSPSMVIGG